MSQKNSKISAIILTKNDEQRIRDCLTSVAWTDEQIVVDNGSADKTVTIAHGMGAFIVEETERIDFAKLRNVGANRASENFLLYVDSDEQVTPALREEILECVRAYKPGISPVAYFIPRKNFYQGRLWPHRDSMERLFWKKGLRGWRGKLHESPVVAGTVGRLKQFLLHNTHRTLEEMLAKTNQWSALEADLRFRAGHPPVVSWRLLRVMGTSFIEYFVRQSGWRVGTAGWIESIFQAYSSFVTYAKLWELQHT